MANPAPNPNVEIDAAVKSSVDKFQHGKGAEAIVDINKLYDQHGNDAVFRSQFTGELTKGLKDQGLLPAAAEELFGIQYERNGRQSKVKHNGFSRLDLNGDYKVDGNELAKFLSNKALKGTLSPFEQQMVGYLQVNKDTIAGKDNDITPGNLRSFAGREKERELENRVADRILADPKGFHDRYTQDQYISEDAINRDLDFCNKMSKFPGLNQEQLKDIEARKETGEYLLKHRSEMSTGTGKWFSDNASQDSLSGWAQRIREQNRETVPTVELVGKGSKTGLDQGQAGWMPDLIERYASPTKGVDGGGGHFQDMALSGAGDDKRITKGDLRKYMQVNPDLTPFEKKIVNNMITHYDEIAGASGLHSKSEGISSSDLAQYKINQDKIRAEETIANKTLNFLNNPNNYNQFKDSSNGYLTPASVQREISAANASLAGLEAVPANLQTDATRAQIKALQERRDIGEYLNKHIPDMRDTIHWSDGVDMKQVREFITEQNKRHALDEFVDGQGNKSTPAAAAKEAAKDQPKDVPPKDQPKDQPKDAPPKDAPPTETGLALRKSLGLPPTATDKEVDERFNDMLSGKWTPPEDDSAKQKPNPEKPNPEKPNPETPKAKPEKEAELPKKNPYEDPQLPGKLEWNEGLKAGLGNDGKDGKPAVKPDYAAAEAHLRKAAETFPPGKNDNDGNQLGTDLAEAILNNPANAGNRAKRDEAEAMLKQAQAYFKDHPDALYTALGKLSLDKVKEQAKSDPKPAEGFTPDLMNQFVNDHFYGMAGAGATHLTKKNLDDYLAANEKTMAPQDKQVLGQLQARYDAVADKDGMGITKASMDAYAKAQAAERAEGGGGGKQFSGLMTEKNFQAIAEGKGPLTETQLKDWLKLNNRILGLVGDSMPAAKKQELTQQIALAGYLQEHYKDLATKDGAGQPVGIDFAKAKAALDKGANASQDYMDAVGNSTKPIEKPKLGQWPDGLKPVETKPEAQPEKPAPEAKPEKTENDWDKYIRENVTEKGGYAGAGQYGAAREAAARDGKELVIVVGSRDRPQMLQGVATSLLQGDNRVFLYLDGEKMKSDTTEFGAYVREHLPAGSAKAYSIWQNGDSFQWQERYGLPNFGGALQYNPQPQSYQQYRQPYNCQQQQQYQPQYQQQYQPQYRYRYQQQQQPRGLFGWR